MIEKTFAEHQRRRWMRPNAHLWIRPDAYRFMPRNAPRWYGKDAVRYFWPEPDQPNSVAEEVDPATEDSRELEIRATRDALLKLKSDLLLFRMEFKFRQLLRSRKYRPDQPRVPAGNPDGGQWTADTGSGGTTDRRVISDESPDPIKPGAQYAEGRRPPSGPRGPLEPTPAQAARLTVAEAHARSAIRQVQELDPGWKPPASVYETVEGLISSYQADTQAALARLQELRQNGIGPGLFAGKSIPARGPDRNFTPAERQEINRIGSETGCHTCGAREPDTPLGNFVVDHQPPTALNRFSSPQRLYPQCVSCSVRQGGWVRSLRQRK